MVLMMQLASTVRTLILAAKDCLSKDSILTSFLPTTVLRPVGLELTKEEKTLVETCIMKTTKLMTKNAK